MIKQIIVRSILLTFSTFIIFPSNTFALPTTEHLNQTIKNCQSKERNQSFIQKFIKIITPKKTSKTIKKSKLKDSGKTSLILGLASPLLLILTIILVIYFNPVLAIVITLLSSSIVSGVIALFLGIKTIRFNKQNGMKNKSITAILGTILGGFMTALYFFYIAAITLPL